MVFETIALLFLKLLNQGLKQTLKYADYLKYAEPKAFEGGCIKGKQYFRYCTRGNWAKDFIILFPRCVEELSI